MACGLFHGLLFGMCNPEGIKKKTYNGVFVIEGCDCFGFSICCFGIANLFNLEYACLVYYCLYVVHCCNTFLLA